MITTYREILPGINLRVVETDRFKTCCFSANFLIPLTKRDATMGALIPRILRRGTERLPDMTRISAELDQLYGARIEPIVRKFGDVQASGIICDLITAKALPDGETLLEDTLRLALEVLFNPITTNDAFLPEYVDSERDNLRNEILSEFNEKLNYAYRSAVRKLYADVGFGVPALGEVDELAKTTPKDLYSFYKKTLRTVPLELFFCGNANFNEVQNALLPALKAFLHDQDTLIKLGKPTEPKKQEICERYDVSQADLLIGLYSNIHAPSDRQPALQVLSTILGGGTASKLFINVRERKSLCYFTGTIYDKYLQTVFLYSGVDPDKVEEARGEMLKQLITCQDGKINEQELEFAKRRIIDNLKSMGDLATALESYWLGETVLESECDPERQMKKIQGVSIEEACEVAQTLNNVMTYVLTGKEGHHARKSLPGN